MFPDVSGIHRGKEPRNALLFNPKALCVSIWDAAGGFAGGDLDLVEALLHLDLLRVEVHDLVPPAARRARRRCRGVRFEFAVGC